MLEVSQLSRLYGSFVAVENVSFTIGKGEIVGLLGHNGAGKTTIMKMLSGYLEPNHGRVRIGGIDLTLDPKKVQADIGYLPENLPIYSEMAVADYLDYAADLKGLKDQNKYHEIRRAIKATEIGDKLLAPINTLSRGYKQRVGVAQAILGKPRLMILDEPANGLDPTQTDHMRQLIRDMAKDATVILSTHIMQEVDAVCDRVLILRGGQLVVDEKLDELRSISRLLLKTNMMPKAAKELLQDVKSLNEIELISGDQQVEEEKTIYRYRVALNDEQDADKACAALANAVIDAGADIYQLQQEHRDLETLFRELNSVTADIHPINSKEMLSDAA